MVILVKGIGVLVGGMGVLFFLQPPLMRRFLAAAPQCRQPAVAAVLGSTFVLSAATVFVTGPDKLDGLFRWWDTQSGGVLRLMGLIALTFGLLLYTIAS